MSYRSCFQVALKALSKNKLQTALTMIGLTIGVATVLTMIALGSGAQSAIEDQVRAAGMNLIVVTAGNYKVKTQDDLGVVENAALSLRDERLFQSAVYGGDQRPRWIAVFHPEDDPMEKHDHPTAS